VDEEEPRISREEENEWRFLIEEQQHHHRMEDGRKGSAGQMKLQLPQPLETPTPIAHTGHNRDASGDPDDFYDDDLEKDISSLVEVREVADYFLVQRRPALPRSHWSASTIQTATTDLTPTPQPQVEHREFRETRSMEAERTERTTERESVEERQLRPLTHYPNFSVKRSTVPPKRPALKAVDDVENFMKRGGWKRRGIVFQQDSGFRTSTISLDDGLF
jgi:hypothetical protein